MRKFILNNEKEEFDEVEDHVPKTALIKPENIILFISDIQKAIWIWIGSGTTQKQRFLAPYKVNIIKGIYTNFYRIKTAEQGSEPVAFLMMFGSGVQQKVEEFKEIYIRTNELGIDLIDNRGNMIFVSKEYIPQLLEQLREMNKKKR